MGGMIMVYATMMLCWEDGCVWIRWQRSIIMLAHLYSARTYKAGQKKLSEFIYERKTRLMEAKFREELKKNKDNQNEKR
jgi:hypothetical protein